jgi:hypothetical protein
MKRYIKINSKKDIIDIFHEHVRSKIDGTEILFDEVEEQSVHLMGKCITDEWGFPLFRYEKGKVVETNAYDTQRQDKAEQIVKDKAAADRDLLIQAEMYKMAEERLIEKGIIQSVK